VLQPDPQVGAFNWQHIIAAVLAGGGATILGRHGMIQIRLMRNGGDRRRQSDAQPHAHSAECTAGFEQAVSQLDKGIERLTDVIAEHNRDAARRHESMITILADIRANTAR